LCRADERYGHPGEPFRHEAQASSAGVLHRLFLNTLARLPV
jgi:hypothetical protein